MKQTIKCVSLLLAVVLILTSLPLCNAFASDGQSQDAIPADGLIIEVSPGKDSYAYSDTASIKVKVTNKYDFPVENVTVCLYSDSCKVPKGEKCISDKFTLGSGKSKSVQFHAKLGSTSKLNIFQRIILFFRNLFNPADYFKHIDDKEKESFECSELFTVRFDTIDCLFDTTVYYTYNMQEVDEDLEELLKSPEFDEAYNKDLSEAFEMVTDCLDNMENEGLVRSYSSDEDDKEVWFEYQLENNEYAVGGVDLLPPEEGKNSSADAVQAAANRDDGLTGSMMFFDALSGVDYNSSKNLYNKICESLDKYNASSGHNRFTYEDCKNLDCSKPSFICLSSHGGETTELAILGRNKKPYIMMSDYPAGNVNFEKDKANLTVGTLFIKDKKYGVVFPKFFKNKDFKNTVVFFESCCAFGGDNKSTDFADALTGSGCLAVIGFQHDVDSEYSRNVLSGFIERFRSGETLEEAINKANDDAKGYLGKEPDKTTGILRCKFKNNGKETILDCGPGGGKQVGFIVHYEDFTPNKENSEGDFFVIIVDKAVLTGKNTDEIANIAREEIKKLGYINAVISYVEKNGEFYTFNAKVTQ